MTAPVDPGPGSSYWQREPARLVGQVVALLGLLAAGGLQISDKTTAAITSLASAAAFVLAAEVTRKRVASTATTKRLKAAANPQAVMGKTSGLHPMVSMPTFPDSPFAPPFDPPPVPEDPAITTLIEGLQRLRMHPAGTHPTKKLGRRTPKNAPAVRFGDHLDVAAVIANIPASDPPPQLSWPMDHNDTVGDCVVAGWDHFQQVVNTLLTGSYTNMSDAELLALYQTQNPGFKTWADAGGAHDGGMDIQTMLELLVKEGKILGFGKVDHTNMDEVHAATYLNLGLITGEVLTSRNMSEPVWDYHAGDTVEGGHCTVSVGFNPLEDQVSWGSADYQMTNAFFGKRVEEAWFVLLKVLVDNPSFRASFDLASFAAAVSAITSGKVVIPVTPVPAPPEPSPTPIPVPVPTPGPDAGFPVAADLLPHIATAAKRAGVSEDDWLNNMLRKHFRVS